MNTVFLDTVGLLAIWNETDQWHSAAVPVFRDLLVRRCRLVTTSFVLLECGNAAARHAFRKAVNELRQELVRFGNLIIPSEADCDSAWIAYDRGEAGEAGIIDHVSFITMRRMGLTDVFTNDRHFAAAGFHTLF